MAYLHTVRPFICSCDGWRRISRARADTAIFLLKGKLLGLFEKAGLFVRCILGKVIPRIRLRIR